jgi:hypothetical protein
LVVVVAAVAVCCKALGQTVLAEEVAAAREFLT